MFWIKWIGNCFKALLIACVFALWAITALPAAILTTISESLGTFLAGLLNSDPQNREENRVNWWKD